LVKDDIFAFYGKKILGAIQMIEYFGLKIEGSPPARRGLAGLRPGGRIY
jgi:hypothetical protein